MMKNTDRLRRAFAAVFVAALLVVAACGGYVAEDSGDGGDDSGGAGDITLTVAVFGGSGFGYEELIAQYQADHPGITVDYQIVADDYDNVYRPALLEQLDDGTAPDIATFEEQGVGQMMAMSDAWVDLAEYGLAARQSDYPAWKWELGHTHDGKLAGLGTDVGGMAMCYRIDVFAAAGLPTDREEVAAMWSTWDDFADVAADFIASGVDAAFVDSVNQIWNIRLIQEAGAGDGTSYFDRDNTLTVADSPAVQAAFAYLLELNEMGAIGPYSKWSEEWFEAMDVGGYATMGCPAWMMGVIEGASGEHNAGNWDAAPVPGGGGGNWGGSWLAVTKDSQHPAEAAALVDYLTSVEGQLAAWEAVTAFPSAPAAAAAPSVAGTVNEYFSGAPSGQLYAASVAAFDPVFYGELHSAVRSQVEEVLYGLVHGDYTAENAWDAMVAAAEEVVQLN